MPEAITKYSKDFFHFSHLCATELGSPLGENGPTAGICMLDISVKLSGYECLSLVSLRVNLSKSRTEFNVYQGKLRPGSQVLAHR